MAQRQVIADVAAVQISNAGGNGATQNFTIPNFNARAGGNPKAAILLTSGSVQGPEGMQNQARFSIGITDGTRQYAACTQSRTAVAQTATARGTSTNAMMLMLNNAATLINARSTFSSFITDGVTLTHDDAHGFGSPVLASLSLFGGPGLQVHCGEAVSSATIGGTVSVTDPGFTPDVIIAFSTDAAGADPHAFNAHAKILLGFADNGSSITQGSWNTTDRDAESSVSDLRALPTDTYMLHDLTISGDLRTALEVTSFDDDGFTATTRVHASALTFYYMALKFNGAKHAMQRVQGVDDTTIPTTQVISFPGFKPQWGMAIQTLCDSAIGSVVADNEAGAFSVGAVGESAEASVGRLSRDNAISTICRNWGSDDFIFTTHPVFTPFEQYHATVLNDSEGRFFRGGIKLRVTSALSGLNPHIWYLFIEDYTAPRAISRGLTQSLGALAGRTFSLGAAIGTTLGQLGSSVGGQAMLGAVQGKTHSLGAEAGSSNSGTT